MPTRPEYRLPKPKSPDEFEDIATAVLRILWGSDEVRRHGRNGQRQYGVDVLGEYQKDGTRHGAAVAQCSSSDALDWSKVERDIADMDEGFEPRPVLFAFVSAADRSAPLQQQFAKLNEERLRKGKCGVVVLFWEDVGDVVLADRELLARFYPDLHSRPAEKASGGGFGPLLALGGLLVGSYLTSRRILSELGDEGEEDDE
ncbi:MAG: hypothetical protein HYZ29_07905 [Myxococcales bacterium]|nr:hypothetical protein [Myxococcales bacterium]